MTPLAFHDFTHICSLISVRAKEKKREGARRKNVLALARQRSRLDAVRLQQKTTTRNKKRIVTTKGDNRK